MKNKLLENPGLGLRLDYWEGVKKPERVFLAQQIMKQLGYKGGNDTLKNYDLEEGIDKVTIFKKQHPEFIKQLTDLKSVGHRTASVIMLYESGVWKLIMQSKKQIGINTRNWLAREVLPSILAKGYYDVAESSSNPLSYLNLFTEAKMQVAQSKSVNAQIFEADKDFARYHNRVHKLVNGMDAKQIQAFFQSKESARSLIREHLPENAATIALIDEIFLRYGKSLEQIESTGIHVSAVQTFRALFELGVRPMI